MHLENVLVHITEAQDIAIFKSKRDYVRNKKKLLEYIQYVQIWQVLSVICCLYGLYMQHLTCDNTDCILYKIPKDNASYANGIYNYKHQ